MAKKMHQVIPPKDDRMIIHIDLRDIKTRKHLPPPSRYHSAKTDYRRKPKHQKELE